MFERFTERARQVVVLAQDEARALGHDHIDTGHILLGLVREPEGVAARILVEFDTDPEKIRSEALQIMSVLRALPADHGETGRPPLARAARRARWEYRVERWPFADAEGGPGRWTASARKAGSLRGHSATARSSS